MNTTWTGEPQHRTASRQPSSSCHQVRAMPNYPIMMYLSESDLATLRKCMTEGAFLKRALQPRPRTSARPISQAAFGVFLASGRWTWVHDTDTTPPDSPSYSTLLNPVQLSYSSFNLKVLSMMEIFWDIRSQVDIYNRCRLSKVVKSHPASNLSPQPPNSPGWGCHARVALFLNMRRQSWVELHCWSARTTPQLPTSPTHEQLCWKSTTPPSYPQMLTLLIATWPAHMRCLKRSSIKYVFPRT